MSCKIISAASKPFISGIFQSIKTSSKGFFFACRNISIASGPDPANVTSKEKDLSVSFKNSLEVSLSSQTRTDIPLKSKDGANSFKVASVDFPNSAVKLNVLPLPYSLSTHIFPFIISTRRLQIVNPSPVPPNLRVVDESACVKDLNSFPFCSSVNPIPVSLTENLSLILPSNIFSNSVEKTISPFSVNLTELLARFVNICPTLNGSPIRFNGTSGEIAKTTSSPFCCALYVTRLDTLSSTSSRLKSIFSIVSIPASILEKSSISLMIPSSACADLSILIK